MLTETDVHYIAGYLHAVTEREVEQIVLGERVFDEASGTKRDVDIIVLRAGDTGLAGVEVKDETRPLDVSAVEGLCLKLHDMPEIKQRAIVSASGYTEPARRKASSHGVSCLTFVRGAVPPFETIDLSQLQSITILNPVWVSGPHVIFLPNEDFTAEEASEFGRTVEFFGENDDRVPVTHLAKTAAAAAAATWNNPSELGPVRLSVIVNIEDPPILKLSTRSFAVSTAKVAGILRREAQTIPLSASCYLTDESGRPFAATAIVEALSGLFALAVSSETNKLAVFRVPDSVRKTRPHRFAIKPSA